MFARNQATSSTTGFKLLSLFLVFAMSLTLLVPAFAEDNSEDEGNDDRMRGTEFMSLCDQGGGDLQVTPGEDGSMAIGMSCEYGNGELVIWCADDSVNGGNAGEICSHSDQKPASLSVHSGFSISGATQVAPTPAQPALPVFQIQFSTQFQMIGQ